MFSKYIDVTNKIVTNDVILLILMAEETGLEPVMSESKSDVLPVTPFPNKKHLQWSRWLDILFDTTLPIIIIKRSSW